MKIFKKIVSAALTVAMLLTLSACHGKDEVAVTIDGRDIKSALYLNALIDCDSEARSRVDEETAAETEKNETSEETKTSEETDYYSKTLDGLSFAEYVKTKAIERCKEYVFYQKLVDDKVISLTDDEKSEAEYSAEYYWTNYGYSYLYEANGVSLETYKNAFLYSYYSNAYFKSLYGEGGEKEVAKKDIKAHMLDNYALAYTLSATYEDDSTDEEKEALKTKLEGYAKRLKDGEEFEKIYMEFNGLTEKDHTHTEKEDGPKDEHATLLADKDSDSQFASEDFDEVYEMKVGNTKIIESEDGTGLTLYMRLDINSDAYYLTYLTDTILYELKEEEFDDFVAGKTEKYTVEENGFAINRFDVEDIDYSVLQEAYAAANTAA